MSIQVERLNLFVILVTILLILTRIESLRFDLESGHTKCISEDIKSNSMTVGKYQIVNPNEGNPLPDSHKITVRVTSASGNSYHYSDHVTEGNFAYQASEAGDYMACFFAADHKPPLALTIDFDWKSGVAAKDWSYVAKKGSVELMELELKKMIDTVQAVHDEMYYLREREEEMQQLNRSTNSKMFWFSFLSIGICLSVAGLQGPPQPRDTPDGLFAGIRRGNGHVHGHTETGWPPRRVPEQNGDIGTTGAAAGWERYADGPGSSTPPGARTGDSEPPFHL